MKLLLLCLIWTAVARCQTPVIDCSKAASPSECKAVSWFQEGSVPKIMRGECTGTGYCVCDDTGLKIYPGQFCPTTSRDLFEIKKSINAMWISLNGAWLTACKALATTENKPMCEVIYRILAESIKAESK